MLQQHQFLKVFSNPEIQDYMAEVIDALIMVYGRDRNTVQIAVLHDVSFLDSHLSEYPEIMYHEDPIKVAELLAVRWNWVSGRQLQAI